MNKQSNKNKEAWEYRAYEFWNMRDGSPEDKAGDIIQNPKKCLKKHKEYFDNVKDLRIANPCGSNGRKAVPLALMGAEVTVFDISEENKKYAIELANSANIYIEYVVGDFFSIDRKKYKNYFDILYLEGGILHYFDDINKFIEILYDICKEGGKLILSDFHPLRKVISMGQGGRCELSTNGSYFESDIHNGELAYMNAFDEVEQKSFPDCLLRYYTLSEVINSVIVSGFTLKEFNEHPSWKNDKVPGEFTIFAEK